MSIVTKIRNFLIISLVFLAPLAAESNESQTGLTFNAGFTGSYMTFFTYENIGYVYYPAEWENGIEIGVRLLENYLFDPYFYYCPYLQIDTRAGYVGLGLLNSVSALEDNIHKMFLRLGLYVGEFKIANGLGKIDVGLEISPTIFFDPYCKYPGSTILSSRKAAFVNQFKINMGFSYWLPF